MKSLGVLGAVLLFVPCPVPASSAAADAEPACQVSAVSLAPEAVAAGVRLQLPRESRGPRYDSDDYYQARPTWEGSDWKVHFVFGNGGLTEFVEPKRPICWLNDATMRRRVVFGDYMYYSIIVDLWRIESPGKVSSLTIKPGSLSESAALGIVASTVTTWERE